MSNRLLSIKHRPMKLLSDAASLSAPPLDTPRPGTYRYFVRGKNYHPGNVSERGGETKSEPFNYDPPPLFLFAPSIERNPEMTPGP